MNAVSWAVSKRKMTPNYGAATRSRKRRRTELPPDSEHRRQQTLTQAEWVPSRPQSFQDEASMIPLDDGDRLVGTRKLKRESTLTQMDFFNTGGVGLLQPFDDELGRDLKQKPSGPPQLDGTFDEPRKRRTEKSNTHQTTTSASRQVSKESQEHTPSPRMRRETPILHTDPRPSRWSKRIGSKASTAEPALSNPAESLQHIQRGISSPATTKKAPILEIQDSMATNDDIIPPIWPQSSGSKAVQTPQKQRPVVPSSQSPESLPPSTRKKIDADEIVKSHDRSPLRERSVNLSCTPRGKSRTKMGRKDRPRQTSPRASKIVSLKLPKRKSPARQTVVPDPQTLWSLPVTSSPPKQALCSIGFNARHDILESVLQLTKVPPNEAEIPTTGQAVAEVSQKAKGHLDSDLPDLDDLLGFHGAVSNPNAGEDQTRMLTKACFAERTTSQLGGHDEVIVRDCGRAAPVDAEPEAENYSPRPAGLQTPQKVAPGGGFDIDSEFGSPVANDTQFHAEVAGRNSSQDFSTEEDSHQIVSTKILSDAKNKLRAAAARLPDLVYQHQADDGFSTRQPRLVSSSRPTPQAVDLSLSKTSSEEDLLPPTSTGPSQKGSEANITKVPLNDTLHTSSPMQSYRLTSQRSKVKPASLPHPSQMSTQEATQFAMCGMSSMVVSDPSDTPVNAERITIKDSSSVHIPLSQIPAYVNSQRGVINYDEHDAAAEAEDEEASDLNPPDSSEPELQRSSEIRLVHPTSKRKDGSATIESPPAKRRRSTTSKTMHEQSMLDQAADDEEDEVDLDPTSSQPRLSGLFPAHNRGPTATSLGTSGHPATSGPPPQSSSRQAPVSTKPTGKADAFDLAEEVPSSTQTESHSQSEAELTPRATVKPRSHRPRSPSPSPSLSDSLGPTPLKEYHSPIEGFNNETQSNFTQGGHMTAAWVHRQRERGLIPHWYKPKPFKVPGYTRR